uniref:Movement protein n=1 Tax=Nippostrongylus brasiliensis TaxID=27835 RepID=A0A0N4XR14_NIPBR
LRITIQKLSFSLSATFVESLQAHFYEPVRTVADFEPDTLHIRDDCLDMATESVHRNFGIFYPTLHIFGPDTVALKSLVTDNSCGPLRPQFPRPASTANFMHPLSGRLDLASSRYRKSFHDARSSS